MDQVSYDFFHHLYDTLILLGAPIEIATMVRNPDVTTEADVDEVRRFNCELITQAKHRLININTTKITPGGDQDDL